jgi:hypothetical protein
LGPKLIAFNPPHAVINRPGESVIGFPVFVAIDPRFMPFTRNSQGSTREQAFDLIFSKLVPLKF